ncbi:Serine/threonine protein kinase [Operophtera brumata]|uniref:Serine/threonine protein kinase n=1 Tax=Operophtera brumata TaxID=104452 RepID=A0A0L7LLE6_OPEBR|nr:Serine/threonine protein kinase [Operophtera brumata]
MVARNFIQIKSIKACLWVNCGYEASCLEVAEALAAETPVRLDLLLSLAPAAPSNSNSVMVPPERNLGPEESCTDLTSSTSMAVEPSNSAEKRILDLVAEGGEDAIKPSPTRTIVSAGDNKRKLELAMSSSGLQRKKERVARFVLPTLDFTCMTHMGQFGSKITK